MERRIDALFDCGDGPPQNEKPQFWYNRQDWTHIPKGSFDGTLFAARLPVPFDLPRLDEKCAPYISGYGTAARAISSLRELVASDERTAGIGMHPEKTDVHETLIDQVSIVNLTENEAGEVVEIPIRTCYEKGWWCVSFRIYAIVPDVDESCVEHTRRADALLALLGKPTCIMVSDQEKSAFETAVRGGEGRLCYFLVYEYDEYVLVFRITDVISREYKLATLSVNSCMYYTKALWEYDRSGKNVILTP